MKKLFTLCFALFCSVGLMAQDTFSDDFEAFAVGDYISSGAANWTTWSGTTGTAEDAQVTDERAASGTNAIKFEGAAAGGPQDVILDFGGVRTDGQFNFSANFYMEAGNGGYFNFQGAANPGTTWSMNCFMNADGSFTIDDVTALHVSTRYPQDQWFNVTIEANLTANFWKVLIDGQCVGSFSNAGTNAVASLDLFPIDGTHNFFVDDVSYTYDSNAGSAPQNDAQVIFDNNGTVGFAGGMRDVNGFIVNAGTTMVNSVDLDYTIDGAPYSQSLTGLNLAPGAFSTFTLDNQVTLSDGAVIVEAIISSVNDVQGDDNTCNDATSLTYTGFTPHPERKVWAEEATGTWCVWCPRGDVFMNLMDERYGDAFVGTAVHNGDPMVVADWDSGVGAFPGFQGYPSVIFERDIIIDPSALENSVAAYLQEEPVSIMVHEATYDEATRALNLTVHTEIRGDQVGDMRLIVGLTEDGVTGTAAGYNQANAYAGGNTVMGGYENLPNPVPAADMVYNHTSRDLLTPFDGIEQAFSTSVIVSGGWYEHSFTYTIPTEWDTENMHIISAVTANGSVDNAQTSKFLAAVDTKDLGLESSVTLSPNPASQVANVRVQLEEQVNLSMVVTDAMGKVISQRNYGNISGDQIFPINISSYPAGVYYVKVNADDGFATKKLIVTK